MKNNCREIADIIVEAMDAGIDGAVRNTVEQHCFTCPVCQENEGALRELSASLDPELPNASKGFLARVMAEIRATPATHQGSYNRLPPLWQIAGALSLLTALTAVVLATGGGENFEQRVITGFLDQALVFLGELSHGLSGLWESVAPGKALPILIGCAIVATVLNIGFVVGSLRRQKETVE